MGINWVAAIIIFLFASGQAFAHEPAEGKIHAALGPYVLHSVPYHHNFTSPFMAGVGILAEGDIDDNGGIEIGIFYFPEYFSIYRDGMEITEKAKRIYITMGYRHWFTKQFSMAFAFFSNYSMSEAEVMNNDFGPYAPKTSAHDMTEYGFDASVQWEFWNHENFSLLVDARYSYSMTMKSGEDQNFVAGLVALKFYVQGHEGRN